MDELTHVSSLDDDLERAQALEVSELADAIQSIGFECTRCGACCTADRREGCGPPTGESASPTGESDSPTGESESPRSESESPTADDIEPHTATVFPDEIRRLQEAADDADWRDVARPMPFGLETDDTGRKTGETFEWALQTDDCGDCAFYAESADGTGACTVHADRPLICRTYPFSVALAGTSQPLGEAVDEAGLVRAHECDGLGRDITREGARSLARELRRRAIREIEEAIALTDRYEPVRSAESEVVVFDSEGPKRPDGSHLEE